MAVTVVKASNKATRFSSVNVVHKMWQFILHY